MDLFEIESTIISCLESVLLTTPGLLTKSDISIVFSFKIEKFVVCSSSFKISHALLI